MNYQVKELADCMEEGWKLVPKNCRFASFTGTLYNPTACCPIGHAILGKTKKVGYSVNAEIYFPIVETQKVDQAGNLWAAIINLSDTYKWSTPRVIKWLRSHQG